MSAMTSQITSLTIVYSTVYSDADQRKHQSSTSLAFVRGIHRWPVNSPQKGPMARKKFPFDDVIMLCILFMLSRLFLDMFRNILCAWLVLYIMWYKWARLEMTIIKVWNNEATVIPLIYAHQISKLKCFSSRLADVFAQCTEARCSVENEGVVGAAPISDAPTTSEWSTILLLTKVRLILEVWW